MNEPSFSVWLVPAGSALLAALTAFIATRFALAILDRIARREPFAAPVRIRGATPGCMLAAFAAMQSLLQAAPNALYSIDTVRHAGTLAIIAAGTWLAMRLAAAIADAMTLRYPADVADNLHAWRIRTQTRVLTRTLATLIGVVGFSFALLTFPGVRSIGAGLQIALTQPIRLDDVVIVEGEWGLIEEIGRPSSWSPSGTSGSWSCRCSTSSSGRSSARGPSGGNMGQSRVYTARSSRSFTPSNAAGIWRGRQDLSRRRLVRRNSGTCNSLMQSNHGDARFLLFAPFCPVLRSRVAAKSPCPEMPQV